MSIDINSNRDKSIRVLQGAIDILDSRVTSADLKEIGDFAVSALKSEVQNEGGVVTGDLISKFAWLEDGLLGIRVVNTSDHVIFYEYGRGPVEVKNAKALHWVDPQTGEDVFAMRAGPAEGAGVLDRTMLTEVPKKIEEIIKRHGQELEKL